MAQTVKRLSTMRETWVQSLGWEDPLEKEMAIQYHCLENPMVGTGHFVTVGMLKPFQLLSTVKVLECFHSSGAQTFDHQGPVLWRTVFPQITLVLRVGWC